MFENPKRGRQARNFGKNVPKIVDLKSSSEQIFSENCRWVPLYLVGTSIRTLKTKTQFLRCPFQFSVNEVFRTKADHFSFKIKILAI